MSSVLEKAATEGQLSDWLVGLSGAGSTGLWKDTVLKYADQLGKGGFIHKAASFLLVARKVCIIVNIDSDDVVYSTGADFTKKTSDII